MVWKIFILLLVEEIGGVENVPLSFSIRTCYFESVGKMVYRNDAPRKVQLIPNDSEALQAYHQNFGVQQFITSGNLENQQLSLWIISRFWL